MAKIPNAITTTQLEKTTSTRKLKQMIAGQHSCPYPIIIKKNHAPQPKFYNAWGF